MQVLVQNPYSTPIHQTHVYPSFWSESCLYLGSAFSMTSLMDMNNPLDLSPFLVLDAKMAFFISQLEKSSFLICKNLGPLGTIGSHIFSSSKIAHNEDQKKVARYVKEYFPASPLSSEGDLDQVIVYNESKIYQELWDKLRVGGTYLIASLKVPLEINLSGTFEAAKLSWPNGMSTEYGWRFFEDDWGLNEFEYAKLKKLS
jgi:hypothetical protein